MGLDLFRDAGVAPEDDMETEPREAKPTRRKKRKTPRAQVGLGIDTHAHAQKWMKSQRKLLDKLR